MHRTHHGGSIPAVNGKNSIHFSDEVLHIRVWMHRIYLSEIYGTPAAPRLGGWTW